MLLGALFLIINLRDNSITVEIIIIYEIIIKAMLISYLYHES